MKWSKKAVLYAVVVVLLAGVFVWSQALTSTPQRNDFSTQVVVDQDATTLIERNGWVAEYSMHDDCFRFRVRDMASFCVWASQSADATQAGIVEGEGYRLVWAYAVSADPVKVRWWSSTASRTESQSVAVSDKGQLVAFELGSDEEPWGLQLVAADGAVVAVQPFSR